MLLNMARNFEPAKDLAAALRVLAAKKIISSPAYWEAHALADHTCGGDYVRSIISNFFRTNK
jgi:hypothetical protein